MPEPAPQPSSSTTAQVLVAYASKHGSTAEIAQAIADELAAHGLVVDCRPADEVHGVAGYAAVVIGSAVYMKRWRREARHLLHRHADELRDRPFWIFSSGPIGEQPDQDPSKLPDTEWTEPAKVIHEAEQLGVRDHRVFGGKVPADPGNFVERAMLKNTPPEVADLRNWDEIRAWAAEIAGALEAPVSLGGRTGAVGA